MNDDQDLNRPEIARPGAGSDTRDAVLDAAASMFSERGYLGTSVDDIADVLGSTKGRIYHLYRSKTDLFLDVHLASLRMMIDLVAPIATDSSLSAPDRLRRMAYEQVMAIMTSAPLQKVGLQGLQRHHLDLSSARRREAMRRVIEMRDAFEEHYAQVVRDGIAAGDFAEVPPRVITKPLQGALNWTVVWFDPERKSSREEIERLAGTIADFVVGGAIGTARAPENATSRSSAARRR
jgi:AcrR family transcriptional regulator